MLTFDSSSSALSCSWNTVAISSSLDYANNLRSMIIKWFENPISKCFDYLITLNKLHWLQQISKRRREQKKRKVRKSNRTKKLFSVSILIHHVAWRDCGKLEMRKDYSDDKSWAKIYNSLCVATIFPPRGCVKKLVTGKLLRFSMFRCEIGWTSCDKKCIRLLIDKGFIVAGASTYYRNGGKCWIGSFACLRKSDEKGNSRRMTVEPGLGKKQITW